MRRQLVANEWILGAITEGSERIPLASLTHFASLFAVPMLSAVLFWLFLVSPQISDVSELEAAVVSYWDALVRQDKFSALSFVHPDSRNDFLRRREPAMRSWKLLGVEEISPTTARVTVEIEQFVPPRGFVKMPFSESWLFDGESWRVKILQPSPELLSDMFARAAKATPLPAELRVVPERVRIHFLDRRQEGILAILNGLEEPALVVSFEYDRELFEVIEPVEEVAPGERASIRIRYRGEDESKDLESEVRLVLRQSGKEHVFTVPVVYNHISSAARGVLGLTREEAERLRRGDRVGPALRQPAPPAAPPPADLPLPVPQPEDTPKKPQEKPEPPSR